MRRLSKVFCFIGLTTIVTSCAFESASPKTEKEKAGTAKRPTLHGEWTARTIESNLYDWTNLGGCKLLVYEWPEESKYVSEQGQFIRAEFLVRRQGINSDELAHDTHPVLMTAKELLVGPIGSFYRFEYRLSEENLSLKLKTKDKSYLNLDFRRTSNEPGKPRFPFVTGHPPK